MNFHLRNFSTLFDGAKGAEMLIDLKNDRGELVNVISEHPDVAVRLKAAIPATLYKIQSRYSGERDTKNGKAGKKNGNKLGNKKNKKTKNA